MKKIIVTLSLLAVVFSASTQVNYRLNIETQPQQEPEKELNQQKHPLEGNEVKIKNDLNGNPSVYEKVLPNVWEKKGEVELKQEKEEPTIKRENDNGVLRTDW